MSISLYTPATGFPDLEIKIAYGLARVGIEAGCEFHIVPQQGFYQIELDNFSSDKIKQSFLMTLTRLLSSDRFFDLGVKAKDKGKYSVNEDTIKRLQTLFQNYNIENFYQLNKFSDFNFKKDIFCGHKNVNKFGGSSGLILISSFHAGKPYFRDKIYDKFNMNLCEICGYLAVLGFNSFGFNIQMGSGKNKKYVLVLPVPEKEITKGDLIKLLSLQKTLHNFWLSDLQPLSTSTISLLAKVPSISDIVNELRLSFHLTLVSKDNRGDTVVEQTALVNAINFSKFISYSPYNSAAVEKLLGTYNDNPKISSLIELVGVIKNLNKDSLLKFARLYVQETSTDNWVNLLYPQTAKYLLKEVAMIKQEIIENPALQSLARTLRYFIRERKYGYADDIRNARKDSRDFEETIAKMLREGRLRLEKIHLPNEEESREIFRLANDDFEATKTALVILAFSFPTGAKEEVIEITEEVPDEE